MWRSSIPGSLSALQLASHWAVPHSQVVPAATSCARSPRIARLAACFGLLHAVGALPEEWESYHQHLQSASSRLLPEWQTSDPALPMLDHRVRSAGAQAGAAPISRNPPRLPTRSWPSVPRTRRIRRLQHATMGHAARNDELHSGRPANSTRPGDSPTCHPSHPPPAAAHLVCTGPWRTRALPRGGCTVGGMMRWLQRTEAITAPAWPNEHTGK